jgi:hypothetical protein
LLPVELLLPGLLRYLERGWTFDNIEEKTAISISVHCNFFHTFIEFGISTLYSMHVITSVHLAEAHLNMAEYAEAGFTSLEYPTMPPAGSLKVFRAPAHWVGI